MATFSTHDTLPSAIFFWGGNDLSIMGFIIVTVVTVIVRFVAITFVRPHVGEGVALVGEERGIGPVGLVLVEAGEGFIQCFGIVIMTGYLLVVQFFA